MVVDEPDVGDTYQNLRLRAETLAMESVGAGLRPAPTDSDPAPQVLARCAEQGVRALRTDELGTVQFVTDGERLWLQAARQAVSQPSPRPRAGLRER
jgi:hypothetical protein